MLDLKNLLCAALAAGLFFSASNAEARFGKQSDSSDSDKKEEKKESKHEERHESPPSHVHDASAVAPSRVHDATPVGTSRPPPPPPESPGERVIVVEPAPPPVYYVEPAPPPSYYGEPPPPPPGYYGEPPPVGPPPPEVYTPRTDSIANSLRLGIDGGPMGGGVGVNLFLTFEGERLGLDGRVTGLALPTDDGTDGSDEISVARVHLTYALVAQDHLRWRVEAGFSSAKAPDLEVFGPSLGTSLEARVGGPLNLELSLQGTPFPYRQVDTHAALALRAYPFVFRAGWRTLLLDDAGLVDGVEHQDILSGPFAGIGLFF
ncbi:MAG: hypothetical protein ACJ8AT_12830 [Hyalangium sp.]|uniref:hypothetical protein n=1 Tax=Hyalangium sp. TaxID=2028555 RepID=UPI00389A614A